MSSNASGDQFRSDWLSPKSGAARQGSFLLSFRHLNFPALFITLNVGKSSPISIVPMHSRGQQGSWPKDGSFGSAILRGVGFDSVGNNSGPNSWTDDRASELQNMTKQLQDARRNNLQVLFIFKCFTSCELFPEVFRNR